MDESFPLSLPQARAKWRAGPRVLVVTPVGLHGRGGIDRLNLYLHGYLRMRGDDERFCFLGLRGERGGALWTLTFLAALLRFGWMSLTRRFDLAHIHVSTDGSALRKVAFGLVARLCGRRYVIHYHGMMSPEIEAARPMWLRALGVLARGASRVLVLGEAYRRPFERLGVEAHRIAVVYNGIPDIRDDANIPRATDGTPLILFSGELGERKGSDILIHALGRLKDVPWRCIIAGNGDVDAMRSLARAHGVADRIDFPGWLDIAAVHGLMRQSDIVALPSRAEALPLSLIEGASAGAALVATNVGAVADIVLDGQNGRIVKRHEEDIAAALRQILQDHALRARMQAASRRVYEERFQLAHCAEAILACHEEAR